MAVFYQIQLTVLTGAYLTEISWKQQQTNWQNSERWKDCLEKHLEKYRRNKIVKPMLFYWRLWLHLPTLTGLWNLQGKMETSIVLQTQKKTKNFDTKRHATSEFSFLDLIWDESIAFKGQTWHKLMLSDLKYFKTWQTKYVPVPSVMSK